MQALRDRLREDGQLLDKLDPTSEAYRRLKDKIERRTIELLNYEEQAERAKRAATARLAEQRRRGEESARMGCGLFMILLGLVIAYTTWFSWWIVLGLVLAVVGLVSMLVKDI